MRGEVEMPSGPGAFEIHFQRELYDRLETSILTIG